MEEDPFMTFDWYFTDVSEDAARYRALTEKSTETSILMDLIHIESIIHFALWHELPQNHPIAELWLETETDLKSTIYLAYGGFFRQAFTILRSWFEISVHGVFFSSHYNQPDGRYEQWRRGERNAPANMQDLAESFAARSDKLFEIDQSTIFNKLNPIYSFLCRQTHGQGLDIYVLQGGRDNVPRFLDRSFDIWYEKILEAFDTLCFLYRIFFSDKIASYFIKCPEEMNRVRQLMNSFLEIMPNFVSLMTDVFNYTNAR